jgi:hypothetical protein
LDRVSLATLCARSFEALNMSGRITRSAIF